MFSYLKCKIRLLRELNEECRNDVHNRANDQDAVQEAPAPANPSSGLCEITSQEARPCEIHLRLPPPGKKGGKLSIGTYHPMASESVVTLQSHRTEAKGHLAIGSETRRTCPEGTQ